MGETDMRKRKWRWLVVLGGLALLVLVVLAQPRGRPAQERVAEAVLDPEHRINYLPLIVRVGNGEAQTTPTLGPSPTPSPTFTPRPPTATPTSGPSLTPSATPVEQFRVLQAVVPTVGYPGTEYVFTMGLYNLQDVPAQVTVVDALPEGLLLYRVWPPTGTVLLISGNTFTATFTVAARWHENLFFGVVGDTPPCSLSCYVRNEAHWQASWSGGGASGVCSGLLMLLINQTMTPTPVTPTHTPPIFPTWPDTPTPGPTTPGPSPTPTTVPPTSTRTAIPTLGPSPTP